MAVPLVLWLCSRLYSLGSNGRSPLADAPTIAKSFLSDAVGCFKPANAFSKQLGHLCFLSTPRGGGADGVVLL